MIALRAVVALTLSLALVACRGASAQSCDCDVSASRERSADALLDLDADERQDAIDTHLPWGTPTAPAGAANEGLLHNRHYVINYDADLMVPTWVAYRLRNSDLTANRERTECFRPDPRLPIGEGAICDDYEEPVFDRGHMVPNADMKRSLSAMLNTYMFTNMAPQHDRFNRVIWARLEGYVRDWARAKGEVYVITGAVFDQDGDGSRDTDSAAAHIENTAQGTDRVAVPTHFYKILLHERPNTFIETMTFLLPHDDVSISGRQRAETFLRQHFSTIDEIEAVTGIDFLAELDDPKERAVERFRAPRLWPRD